MGGMQTGASSPDYHYMVVKLKRENAALQKRVDELERAAKAMVDSASYAGDLPPLEDTGERWLIAVEFAKWAVFTDALSDTREEK